MSVSNGEGVNGEEVNVALENGKVMPRAFVCFRSPEVTCCKQ